MENPTKLPKVGGGRLHGYGHLFGTIWYVPTMYVQCLSILQNPPSLFFPSLFLPSPFSLTSFFLSLSPSPFSHLTEPTGPPTSFHVVVLNTTAIEVQWNLPLFQLRNGIIRGYRLFIQQEGEEQERTINIVGNDTTEYIISGLEPGTAYIVSALAYTVGDGPRSIHLTVSTPLISE